MYIPFSQSNFSTKQLLKIFSEMGCVVDYKLVDYNSIIGVSNGLDNYDATVSYIDNVTDKNRESLNCNKSSVWICEKYVAEENSINNYIAVEDPRASYIKFLNFLKKESCLKAFSNNNINCGISRNANIATTAIMNDNVSIGDNTIIEHGCVIHGGVSIGSNCIIRANTVIGVDGIALYKSINGEVLRFPHVAGVKIGSNVEIGANTVVVRGAMSDTIVDNDSVIGNLCNIGHGVQIGSKSWISVGSSIGGNTKIGHYVSIGLGVNIKDNIFIDDFSSVGMGSVVVRDIGQQQSVFGNPAKVVRPLKVGPKR
ncbi:hypothetical protein IB680_03695 [Francisella philomiragia]|uniref:hypothetical protein n=1 Tax=Francisella philomiragia TaxID=28110 RepID=UPI000B58B1C3|nr:hypothetical protein [Francisella philomiragia]MBK2094777.1 hypothetical protein [Francisella philomiragia]